MLFIFERTRLKIYYVSTHIPVFFGLTARIHCNFLSVIRYDLEYDMCRNGRITSMKERFQSIFSNILNIQQVGCWIRFDLFGWCYAEYKAWRIYLITLPYLLGFRYKNFLFSEGFIHFLQRTQIRSELKNDNLSNVWLWQSKLHELPIQFCDRSTS